MLRYQYIAEELSKQIQGELYRPGEKIPGTRALAERFGVSINTVLQAQKILENQGLIESVPRSGFFVRWPQKPRQKRHSANDEKPKLNFKPVPALVEKQRLVMDLIHATQREDLVQLGAALPDQDFLPSEDIRKALTRAARLKPEVTINYSFPPGSPSLRSLLSKYMLSIGCEISSEDLIITSGCHEATVLALRALTQPNDIVLLESPTFYGMLQAVESLQLKALEIPSDPISGIDLVELEKACERWDAKACILVGNFSNPLGVCPTPAQKMQLLDILNRNEIPLIEDDIYGDLAFDGHRPPPYKSFDKVDNVLYCSSFSKTLAPGMRVGWIAPGRYYEKINYLKFTQSLGAASLEQAALAQYLLEGSYARHIRRLQRICSNQIARTQEFMLKHCPDGTRISEPKGGFVLWIELPKTYDANRLYTLALENKISIAPGRVFTAGEQFNHCFRLNCAHHWDDVYEATLKRICELIDECLLVGE